MLSMQAGTATERLGLLGLASIKAGALARRTGRMFGWLAQSMVMVEVSLLSLIMMEEVGRIKC